MDSDSSGLLAKKLNDLLQNQCGSLIRHLNEARPHLSARTYQAWSELEQLQDHLFLRNELITKILTQELSTQPIHSIFLQNVAFAHYLTLDALLPQVQDELKGILEDVQSLLPCSNANITKYLEAITQSIKQDIQAVDNAITLIRSTPSSL